MTYTVKASLKREKTDLAVIIGGLTSLLHLFEVFLNKTFKDGVKKQWMDCMADGTHEFTPTGRTRKPSEELICSWIAKAWSDIPAAIIMNSFLKCDIMNNLDGSEDDMVYNSTEDNINNDELDFLPTFSVRLGARFRRFFRVETTFLQGCLLSFQPFCN